MACLVLLNVKVLLLAGGAELLCASHQLSLCKDIWGQISGVLFHEEPAHYLLWCVTHPLPQAPLPEHGAC